MGNEKVSQMVSLTAGEVAGNDLFMIVDSSVKESKNISVNDVLIYIESTGSFIATHSSTSDSASSIQGNNVSGIVASSSYSLTTPSASHANNSDRSITASFALSTIQGATGTTLNTGSTYQITSSISISSSYAIFSSFASSSMVALNLIYTGGNNGSASYAIKSKNADTASNATTASSVISSSYSTTSSFSLNSNFLSPIKAWGWVTWSNGVSSPGLYKQKNISQITYLGTTLACTGQVYWHQFGVSFLNSIDTIDYMLDGTTISGIFGCGFDAHILMSPTSSRTIDGCTMSIAVSSSPSFSTYFTTATGSATFEIYG